jgi:hypothetical protein
VKKTPASPSDDPWRLHCAAHELGHHLTWTALGFSTRSVHVTGSGDNVEGETRLTNEGNNLDTPQRCRDYLVGLLAGREADILWARHAGRPFRERHSASDLKVYRKIRRHAWAKDTSDHQFRTEATRLVRAHWNQIVRLAPQLAESGRL